jgi:uncharacterized UPF0160 family protein
MKIDVDTFEISKDSIASSELNILTHNGVFHSDEVFASALVIYFYASNLNVKINRTRSTDAIDLYKNNSKLFMLDIGLENNPSMRNFDHHQEGDDVEVKATVMLVLDYLLDRGAVSIGLFEYLKDNLVQFLSNWDLGLEQATANFKHKPLPTIISSFNRYNTTVEQENKQFEKVLNLAISIIENEVEAFDQLNEAKRGFENHTVLHDGVILFNDYNPQYPKLLRKCKGVRYYIHPMNENWVVKTTNSFIYPLPLVKEDGDLVFAHKSRFLTIFRSRDAAINYISNLHELSLVSIDGFS